MTINSFGDLCRHFKVFKYREMSDFIYDNTHCGASISVYGTVDGYPFHAHSGFRGEWPIGFVMEKFSIQTIIEGSDATVDHMFLVGETTDEDIDTWIAFMEEEASRLWAEANG